MKPTDHNDMNVDREIESVKNTLLPLTEEITPPAGLAPGSDRLLAATPKKGWSRGRKMTVLSAAAACLALLIVASTVTLYHSPKRITEAKVSSKIHPGASSSGSVPAVSGADSTVPVPAAPAPVVADIRAKDYTEIYTVLDGIRKTQAAANNGTNGNAVNGIKKAFTASGTVASQGAPAPAAAAPEEGAAASAAPTTPQAETAGGAATDNYGKTNVQVDNVDEADIVKNDGQYIYTLSGNAGKSYLTVVKTGSNGKMQKMSQIAVSTDGFYPSDFYVVGNYAVFVGSLSTANPVSTTTALPGIAMPDVVVNGNSAYYAMYTSDSAVCVCDITNRAAPKILRTFRQNGSVVSSRMVGNNLYLTTSYTVYDLDKLTKDNVKDYVPRNVALTDAAGTPVAADHVSIVPECQSATFAVVSCLNITSAAAPLTESVLGGGQNLYANADNLYVASTVSADPTNSGSIMNTEVLRFNITNGTVNYIGMGTVIGTVLDQYAMDEYNGYFRIATTRRLENQSNNLFVLDSNMKTVGQITGLAKNEMIKSVRFMGDRAYVITFLQHDPLFAFDLSDPKAPKLLGQLTMPGFSSYLYPLDANTLIGIGPDGTDTQSYGLKLSMIDVTDPSKPVEKFKYAIAGQGTDAQQIDAKQFTFDKNRGLLAIPVNVNGYTSVRVNGVYVEKDNFFGTELFKVDKSKGFTLIGRATNATPSLSDKTQYCLDSGGYVNRVTYIGNAWFAVSDSKIVSFDCTNMKRLDVFNIFDITWDQYYQSFTSTDPTLVSPDPANIPPRQSYNYWEG